MDWLHTGNPQPGGNYSFTHHPCRSPQSASVPQSPAPASAHRSPAHLRSFIARYSDFGAPLPQSSRAKSAPATSVNQDSTVPFPTALSHPDPTAVHPVTPDLKLSSTPSILTPPPSSEHGEDRELLFEPTTGDPAPIALVALQQPRIPSPSSVQDLMEASCDNHTIYGITASMLLDWQQKYPFVMDSELINYQYDESTSRFIVTCSPSPAHDSLQIYFQGRLSVELPARMGTEKFLSCVQMSCGSAFGGFTGRHNLLSRKQPDASLQINGDDFPSVVCESGWAEKMDDLQRDARLWLLHTDGQTVAVLVLAFTEVFGGANETDLTAGGVPDPANDAVDEPDTNQEAAQATTGLESSNSPIEETILLDGITDMTTPRALAADLLDLHRRHQLSKPLLGRIDATVHVFRANESLTAIEESYTAELLPAPADADQQAFTLTMFDLLGELAEDEEGIDPDEEVVFPLDALREVLRAQIPKMERMRSVERAANLLKGLGFWQEVETFAQYKRSRKRRRIV